MYEYALQDAFWHPRLGVVLLYEYAYINQWQTVSRRTDYVMPHPTCAEEDAAEFVAAWIEYGNSDG